MRKFIIAVFLVLVLMASPCFATLWYVDNGASAGNDGTSWSDAWESFADIVWAGAGVVAGDTLYISGGASSKIYSERLVVGESGSNGSPITITVGTASPHNGTVRINYGGVSNVGILVDDHSYITIDGQSDGDATRHIEIYQASYSADLRTGITISGTSQNTITKYVYIHHLGDNSSNDYGWGVRFILDAMSNYTGHEVANCLIEDLPYCIDTGVSSQTKASAYGGIIIHHNLLYGTAGGVRGVANVDIYNNTFDRDASQGSFHEDGVQLYGSYIRIYNNLFTDFLGHESGTAVIYWEPDGADSITVNNNQPSNFLLYNNLFLESGTPSAPCDAIQFGLSDKDFTAISDVLVANNTITGDFAVGLNLNGWTGTTLNKAVVTSVQVLNNIFYNAAKSGASMMTLNIPSDTGTPVDYGSYGDGVSIEVDYNIYSGATTTVGYLGSTETYADFLTASGCQDSGTTSDPSLNVSYKPDNSNDPPVDAGVDLSGTFTEDKDGVTRPTNGGNSNDFDIGAYEYNPGAPPVEGTGNHEMSGATSLSGVTIQ